MKTFRKLDQYYFDEYDRSTIKILRELEHRAGGKIYQVQLPNHNSKLHVSPHYSPFTLFYDTGVHLAKTREQVVLRRMLEDERKDNIIKHTPIPKNVLCNFCNCKMQFYDYWFRNSDQELLFVFSCTKGHTPNKILSVDGKEIFRPVKKCNQCNSELISTSESRKDKLIIKTICAVCEQITTQEFDLTEEKQETITQEERKKYCEDFNGLRTFKEDLLAIDEFLKNHSNNLFSLNKDKDFDISIIEKLTIAQIEQRIIKKCNEQGFSQLQFDKPIVGKQVFVQFSVQENSSRKENDSIRVLTRLFKELLLTTNWRLMATGISYRLGYLYGEIKGYDAEADLLRLAGQLSKRNQKYKK